MNRAAASELWAGNDANKRRSVRDECGATAIEYAILCGLIAGVAVLAVTALGLTVKGLFDSVTW